MHSAAWGAGPANSAQCNRPEIRYNGLARLPQKFPFPWGAGSQPNTTFLVRVGSRESAAVQPFLHNPPVFRTHRHTDTQLREKYAANVRI